MNMKYINKLEFNNILEILSNNCVTSIGKSLAINIHPEDKKEIVLSLLKETTEGTSLIHKIGLPPFVEIANFDYIEKIINSNGCLNAKNLLDVMRNFKTIK